MVLRLVVAVVIVAIAVLTQPFTAYGQNLQLPARFHGTVEVGCYPVPDGTVIEAKIAGDTFYTSTSWAPYCDDDYAIMIIPPEGTSYVSGSPVHFKIGDRDAIQVAVWEGGDNIDLNLTDECVREMTTVTYVSSAGDLVAVSYDGSEYGQFESAVVTWNQWTGNWAKIEGAKWISSGYEIEDARRSSWRKFERRFSVAEQATNISGILQITADHRYRATLNGAEIGSGSNMGRVDTWDLHPIAGVNSLTVTVVNDGFWGRSAGPTGLIYAMIVRYEALPGSTLASASGLTPILTDAPAPEPTVEPELEPTASPTVALDPVPTAWPYAAPTRQYVQGYAQGDAQGDAQGGEPNMSKVVGVAFFGMLDVVLIGLLVYLVWRFFIHPRVET